MIDRSGVLVGMAVSESANRLSSILERGEVLLSFRAATPEEAVERLLKPRLLGEGFSEASADAGIEAILNREKSGSTVFGNVALPHARIPGLKRIVASLGLNGDGVFESGPSGTRVILAFASPDKAAVEHLKFLAQFAQIFRNDDVVRELLEGKDEAEVLAILRSRER
jgi:mannitol/fructose-specific phosphotransferase system IIA component (Ntr-type)